MRTFKQAYEKKLKEKKKQGGAHAQVTVTSIPEDTRGRPPILLDLDKKLITLLKSIRDRGGVVNFSVVKASALALIKSNPTKDFRGLSQPQAGSDQFIDDVNFPGELEPQQSYLCL